MHIAVITCVGKVVGEFSSQIFYLVQKQQTKTAKVKTYKSNSKSSSDTKTAGHTSREAKRKKQDASKADTTAKANPDDSKMSSLKRKSYTPMSARQTKSIEQIFPDEIESPTTSTVNGEDSKFYFIHESVRTVIVCQVERVC